MDKIYREVGKRFYKVFGTVLEWQTYAEAHVFNPIPNWITVKHWIDISRNPGHTATQDGHAHQSFVIKQTKYLYNLCEHKTTKIQKRTVDNSRLSSQPETITHNGRTVSNFFFLPLECEGVWPLNSLSIWSFNQQYTLRSCTHFAAAFTRECKWSKMWEIYRVFLLWHGF